MLGLQHIVGAAGIGIGRPKANHVAQLKLRIVLMGIFHHAGGGDKLMMQGLIPGLHIVGNLRDRSGVAFYSSGR